MTHPNRIGWEAALRAARRGEPAHLAWLVVRQLPPADLARDVQNILAHPNPSPRKPDGRPGKLDEWQRVAVLIDHHYGASVKELAEAYGVGVRTIQRILEAATKPAQL